jgi:hypothetical protein
MTTSHDSMITYSVLVIPASPGHYVLYRSRDPFKGPQLRGKRPVIGWRSTTPHGGDWLPITVGSPPPIYSEDNAVLFPDGSVYSLPMSRTFKDLEAWLNTPGSDETEEAA